MFVIPFHARLQLLGALLASVQGVENDKSDRLIRAHLTVDEYGSFPGPNRQQLRQSESMAQEESSLDLGRLHVALLASLSRAKRVTARTRSFVEQDLRRIATVFEYQSSMGCEDNARAAWHTFKNSSAILAELEPCEINNWGDRFEEKMKIDCKLQQADQTNWAEAVKDALNDEKPLATRKLVRMINDGNFGYMASYDPCVTNQSVTDLFTGRLNTSQGPTPASLLQHATRSVPASFDSREKWPHCSGIAGRVQNQGRCGSCWAFSAALAIETRLCIVTNGAFSGDRAFLSRGFTASCLTSGGQSYNGCNGGLAYYMYMLLGYNGVPTGGDLGCSPYFGHGEGTEHFASSDPAPPCPTQCSSNYARELGADTFKIPELSSASSSDMYFAFGQNLATQADVYQRARIEIYDNGPITAGIYVDGTFMAYSSGVYQSSCSQNANHEIATIGWGNDGDTDYWRCVNSWGTSWGSDGHFKVATCVLTDFTFPPAISDQGSFPSVRGSDSTSITASTSPPPSATPPSPLPSATPRVTTKGCACGNNWQHQKFPSNPCTTFCCNPDSDPNGVWCIVEDQSCEHNTWGYCAESTPAAAPTPSPMPPAAAGGRLTEAGCACKNQWQLSGTSQVCSSFCCNLDADPNGEMCAVEDPSCQGGATWGYCRATTSTTSTTSITSIITNTSVSKPVVFATGNASSSNGPWRLTAGDCARDSAGCIMSPGYSTANSSRYPNRKNCTFLIESSVVIEVLDFSTEAGFDKLVVNSVNYSGSESPHGVLASGSSILWITDNDVVAAGWKLCPRTLGSVPSSSPGSSESDNSPSPKLPNPFSPSAPASQKDKGLAQGQIHSLMLGVFLAAKTLII